MKTLNLTIILLAAALGGCQRSTSASAEPLKATPTPAAEAPAAAPPAEGLSGVVLERIDAASYSYLRLKTKGGEAWAAVTQTPLAVGAAVTVLQPLPMHNFQSKTLNRTFPLVYFGRLADDAAPAQPAMPANHPPIPAAQPAMPANHPPIPAAQPADPSPAAGTAPAALKIADVYAQAGQLNGALVKVTGKVVKFNAQILNRNWVHIQDGSGAAAQRNHDLTLTTQATLKVDQEVTLQGTLVQDKDFGAGYKYAVIIEGAVVVP
ncbi:nucleotide-binding protein [Myxococcota bacterium]|nr:nucleotide-binding protein [Myxococcota bacterium]